MIVKIYCFIAFTDLRKYYKGNRLAEVKTNSLTYIIRAEANKNKTRQWRNQKEILRRSKT